MAKKPKKAKIRVVVPDHIAKLDQETLTEITRLLLGDSSRFGVSEVHIVHEQKLSATARTELDANARPTSGCP